MIFELYLIKIEFDLVTYDYRNFVELVTLSLI